MRFEWLGWLRYGRVVDKYWLEFLFQLRAQFVGCDSGFYDRKRDFLALNFAEYERHFH